MIVKERGGNFTPAPEGLHNAVCVDVVDMGTMRTKFGESEKVRLVFELPIAISDSGGKFGHNMTVSKLYTPSLNEKATLRKDLVAWRGRQFTADELAGFDLESVIGVPCQILVVHNHKDGKVYANVTSIIKAGTRKMRPTGTYVRVQNRDQEQAPSATLPPMDPDYLPPAGEPEEGDDVPF